MNTQRERIYHFISEFGYSVREFERILEVSNGTIRHLGDNLSANLKGRISSKFPLLNMDWVLSGVGSMLIQDEKSVNVAENTSSVETFVKRIADLEGVVEAQKKAIAALEKVVAAQEREIESLNMELRRAGTKTLEKMKSVSSL